MEKWHSTTVLCVRHQGKVAMVSDGQVTLGTTVMKQTAAKIRRLKGGEVIAGFAGSSADAFALFSRFEMKLEEHRGNLERSAIELAKDWRTDKMLRQLEALLIVADKTTSLLISGTGDLISPEEGVLAIGSGGPYALAAAPPLIIPAVVSPTIGPILCARNFRASDSPEDAVPELTRSATGSRL